MRTTKQIYERIAYLEGLRTTKSERINELYKENPMSLDNIRNLQYWNDVLKQQINELLWTIDEVCPKCKSDNLAYDEEYYYCANCYHVWRWRE